MSKDGDVGFDFDEKTSTPTIDEIKSTLGINNEKPRIKNPWKKIFGIGMVFFTIVVLVVGGGIWAYKTYGSEQIKETATGMVIGISPKLTGFFTNDITSEDISKFGITIKKAKIDLTQEEESLKTKVQGEEETECTSEKNTLRASLQTEIDSWKDKYEISQTALSSCEDDLSDCEDTLCE